MILIYNREDFPTRINLVFKDRKGQVVLDQIRTIDRIRIIKVLGQIGETAAQAILSTLSVLFSR